MISINKLLNKNEMIQIVKGDKYIGDFITVEVRNVNGIGELDVYGRYDSNKEYLILGEKRRITKLDYLKFAMKELDTIRVMILKGGRQL